MSKDIKQNTDYGFDIQKLYLEMMLADAETFVRCQSIFDHSLFDRKLQPAAEFINKHVTEFNTLPTFEIVKAATKVDLESPGTLNEQHLEWLMSEFETFTRHKSLERAILKAADMLENGEYGPVEGIIKEAVQISLQKDLGINYYEDPVKRLESLKNRNGQMSTGWASLDQKMYGGFNKGELVIFAAQSGGGKSVFLANLAVNYSQSGNNVVYLTLELSEELVGMRIDAMTTGIASKEIFKNLDEVNLKVKMLGKKNGAIQLKYMPSGKTANDVRSYLKEYQVKTGKKVDVLVIDYLDLLMPNGKKISAENLFIKDKFVSEELRNLAMELNCLVLTAAQLNRCLDSSSVVDVRGKGLTTLREVAVGDYIKSDNGFNEVLATTKPSIQSVFEIKTKNGKKIKATSSHVFPTNMGEVCLIDGLSLNHKFYNSETKQYDDDIVSIEFAEFEETMDIQTDGNNLFYANGILTHNCAVEEQEFDHSHISGGLSKIQTADAVFGIFTSRAMRERGKYQLQFMKTRNSGAVGQNIELDFDVDTLRVTDPGLDEVEEQGMSKPNAILDAIKRKSLQSPSSEVDEPKVKAKTESASLRNFLNNLPSSDPLA